MKTTVLTAIPQELIDRDKWVLWKLEQVIDDKTGKPKVNKETGEIEYTKVPYQINGIKAGSTNRATWTTYDKAVNALKSGQYSGIGYVLTSDDPYTVIDLDDCIIDGKMKAKARELIEKLDSYTEYSQSGKGVHIFIKGRKPGKRSKNREKGIEIYDDKRFIVMTGNHIEGTSTEIKERQIQLEYIYNSYFSMSTENPRLEKDLNKKLKPSPNMEDDEILEIAFRIKNGDVTKRLYNDGDISMFNHDKSAADQSLCNRLAFLTQNPEQIDRIFRKSGLYREKWDSKRGNTTYGMMTIERAINDLNGTYQRQNNYQLNMKDSPILDLKKELRKRHFKELAELEEEWKANGKKGRKPITINPVKCSLILPEYISFALFDLEENTRLAMYLPNEGIYTQNTTVIKRVISWLEPKLNNAKSEEVIFHLTNMAEVREKTNSRYLIPVKNGVFNLRTKQLEAFNPEYVFTTKISTAYVHRPEKPIIDGWDIDEWMNSIACGDKEIVNLLWQVISDSLNGNYSRKKAIFLIGEGNNGKGTFQELITNLVGLKNIATLKVNEFDERFKLSLLEGKTAVIGDDVPAGVYIDDSSNFNSVVTGDLVQVEFKNKPIYNTAFKCSVIQSTNGMPKFKNKTTGTIRRLVIVPFKADFNGEKENFKIKDNYIKNERVLQYVLYKAINMDFEEFDIPQASLDELEIFKQDNDPVLEFKLSVFDQWALKKVPKYVVYEFYKRFCADNGYKYSSNRQFHKQFKKYLGKEWDADGQERFNYEPLLKELGDLDAMEIGFPPKDKNQKSYVKVM